MRLARSAPGGRTPAYRETRVKRREVGGRRALGATIGLAATLGVLMALVPGAAGQTTGLDQTVSTALGTSTPDLKVGQAPSVPTVDKVTDQTTTTADKATGQVTTTTTTATGQTTTTVKDTSGKVVSTTTSPASGAPAATTGTTAPAVPGSAATGAGTRGSTVAGSPGTTILLPSGATQVLTASTPLPSGTRFDTVGRPPPPAGPNVMKPFPVVRIAGTLTRSGATIRVLSARAPGGSNASARCRGRNCPTIEARSTVRARSAQTSGRIRFRVLQRTYRAGVVLRVYVTAPGKWGKYTRFEIRKGLAPARRDLCMKPGDRRRATPCAAIPKS